MDDRLSSPDPLNDSVTYYPSPAKARRAPRTRHSFPIEGSSPTKQTFELDVGNQLSPQKIRVTVEAGNSDTENAYAQFPDARLASPAPVRRPVNRRRERTTTTTVPVKGLSDSEDEPLATPKRGRGRPRKSAGTPVPAKKPGRASTPTQKVKGRRKSIGSLVDGDDDDDLNFRLGNAVEVERGKGRSRSRSMKGTSRKSTPAAKSRDLSDKIVSSTTSKRGRGRRKTLMPDEVVVLEDDTSGDIVDNEIPEVVEMSGVFSSIDGNEGNPPSACSTVRSATSVEYNERDITIASFDPHEATPRMRGRLSPRMVRSSRRSSSVCQRSPYPSPAASPKKGHSGEDSVALIPVSPDHQAGHEDEVGPDYQTEDEEQDEIGELREFDTILESEGFSMISVDSVPSLREHVSSPANRLLGKDAATPHRNKIIANIQNTAAVGRDDSFSSIPDEVLEAATPGRKGLNSRLLSVQNSRLEDSFSSIPPEVLEAATPARKTRVSNLLARTSARMEDSFSSIASEILDAATPGRSIAKASSRRAQLGNEESYKSYNDSFSAIPSNVLDAATPAPVSQHISGTNTSSKSTAASERSTIEGPVQTLSSALPSRQTSASARLPTPEETPSPLAEGTCQQSTGASSEAVVVAPTEHPAGNESSFFSQMRSSPPSIAPRRYTYTAHLRRKRELFPDKTQTPSIVFSSPSLPPPIQFSKGHPVFASQADQNQRPKLSPAARAGRALQDILVPNSPRGRAQSLGSPFKSPEVRKLSSSAVEEATHSPLQNRTKLFPGLDLTGKGFGTFQREQWNASMHQDDPFSNNVPTYQRSPSPEEKQSYTLGLPEQRRISDPRLHKLRSEDESLRSEDAMSWQAEEELPVNDAATSLMNHINSAPNAGQSSVRSEASILNADDPTGHAEQRWEAEREEVKRQIATANASQVIVIDSDDEASASQNFEDDDDFGLLLETLNSSSPAIEQRNEPPNPSNIEKPRRSKIPSPWRQNSRRLVYNDELSHLSSPPKGPSSKAFPNDDSIDDNEMDLSEFPIPQKASFNPRIRERGSFGISALLASSPTKMSLPVLTKSSQNFTRVPNGSNSLDTSTVRRVEGTSSATKPEPFEAIPQKLGFKPRARNKNMDDSLSSSSPVKQRCTPIVNGIFGVNSKQSTVVDQETPEIASSSSDLKPLGLSSPSRTNALPAPTHRLTISHISPSVDSYDSNSSSILSQDQKENQVMDNRAFKWTETLPLATAGMPGYTSPTKSCFRSPLKTPNAVSGNSVSPTKNVTFVSSSPMPSSPTTAPLSPSIWSRDHWTLLDSILQNWKPENHKDGGEIRRRNSTRVISNLLGKNVNHNGEKMKLQQWHLEVVDEFRGCVDGWQEADVARRVFALLLGEEKRAVKQLERETTKERMRVKIDL